MINLFSPLEQFEILNLIYIKGYFAMEITNLVVFVFLINIIILSWLYLSTMYASNFVPTKGQLLSELSYKFVLNIIYQQCHTLSSIAFFPLFFYIFLFILVSNLIGLIPYSFTVTSQFSITAQIALSINIGLFIFGFIFNGIRFLKFFIPKGVPILLLPLIIIIEIFSYSIRSLSLSVRLFCNMTAGHTLLHMVTSFSVLFLNNSIYFGFVFLVFLILAIYLLELGIGFIQAYVFLILISIYLSDSIHGGH